ncbi:CLUMA_CG021656, isoform A [Clunio marinus]|uniref:CLUMA_CG021656, isoform A n=1 Tax=Clunio marinus TaxID=568069 RepID=A0A1J1JB75_9DIPT|nr:CLUMA_CG021656, isoform A [Clunio marinus]
MSRNMKRIVQIIVRHNNEVYYRFLRVQNLSFQSCFAPAQLLLNTTEINQAVVEKVFASVSLI